MPIRFTNNVRYLGKKAFVEREEYATLALMKAANEAGLNDGLIAYNHEDKKHYVFRGDNEVDETTGKWRSLGHDLKVGKIKIDQIKTSGEQYAAQYNITQGEELVGTINIPRDIFLDSVEYDSGSSNLIFHLIGGQTREVNVSAFVDAFTYDRGIVREDNAIRLEASVKEVIDKAEKLVGRIFVLTQNEYDEKERDNSLPENAIIFIQD